MRCFTEFNTLMTEYTSETEPCVTYKCYNEAIKTILKPVYNQLIQIEMSVKAQGIYLFWKYKTLNLMYGFVSI